MFLEKVVHVSPETRTCFFKTITVIKNRLIKIYNKAYLTYGKKNLMPLPWLIFRHNTIHLQG